MGDFRKNILQTDVDGKKVGREILGKNILHRKKNIAHDI